MLIRWAKSLASRILNVGSFGPKSFRVVFTLHPDFSTELYGGGPQHVHLPTHEDVCLILSRDLCIS